MKYILRKTPPYHNLAPFPPNAANQRPQSTPRSIHHVAQPKFGLSQRPRNANEPPSLPFLPVKMIIGSIKTLQDHNILSPPKFKTKRSRPLKSLASNKHAHLYKTPAHPQRKVKANKQDRQM
ncbi:hypothetical protein NPIL_613681 [Nephila pilipes]|uniref:Uncharacterized protein n=1 Tax=Nephila pilipes TaxID=299642 RepID=A0A8X6QUZ0_NEPPI|nr:hypothetical protein NPIL_613681 [Nephila pilipes]